MIKLTENQREILQAVLDGKDFQIYNDAMWGDFTQFKTLLSHMYGDEKLRIKPPTITVNGVEVPEPMKVKPKKNSKYYTATTDPEIQTYWTGCERDTKHFNAGVCHSTPEAATLHWDAMIKPSRVN